MDRVSILFSMRTPGLLSLCFVAARNFENFFPKVVQPHALNVVRRVINLYCTFFCSV